MNTNYDNSELADFEEENTVFRSEEFEEITEDYPVPDNKKSRFGGSFMAFNLDDIPEYEPLENTLSLLRNNLLDAVAFDKLLKMDTMDLDEHCQWSDLLALLHNSLSKLSTSSLETPEILTKVVSVHVRLLMSLGQQQSLDIAVNICQYLWKFIRIEEFHSNTRLRSDPLPQNWKDIIEHDSSITIHGRLFSILLRSLPSLISQSRADKTAEAVICTCFLLLSSGHFTLPIPLDVGLPNLNRSPAKTLSFLSHLSLVDGFDQHPSATDALLIASFEEGLRNTSPFPSAAALVRQGGSLAVSIAAHALSTGLVDTLKGNVKYFGDNLISLSIGTTTTQDEAAAPEVSFYPSSATPSLLLVRTREWLTSTGLLLSLALPLARSPALHLLLGLPESASVPVGTSVPVSASCWDGRLEVVPGWGREAPWGPLLLLDTARNKLFWHLSTAPSTTSAPTPSNDAFEALLMGCFESSAAPTEMKESSASQAQVEGEGGGIVGFVRNICETVETVVFHGGCSLQSTDWHTVGNVLASLLQLSNGRLGTMSIVLKTVDLLCDQYHDRQYQLQGIRQGDPVTESNSTSSGYAYAYGYTQDRGDDEGPSEGAGGVGEKGMEIVDEQRSDEDEERRVNRERQEGGGGEETFLSNLETATVILSLKALLAITNLFITNHPTVITFSKQTVDSSDLIELTTSWERLLKRMVPVAHYMNEGGLEVGMDVCCQSLTVLLDAYHTLSPSSQYKGIPEIDLVEVALGILTPFITKRPPCMSTPQEMILLCRLCSSPATLPRLADLGLIPSIGELLLLDYTAAAMEGSASYSKTYHPVPEALLSVCAMELDRPTLPTTGSPASLPGWMRESEGAKDYHTAMRSLRNDPICWEEASSWQGDGFSSVSWLLRLPVGLANMGYVDQAVVLMNDCWEFFEGEVTAELVTKLLHSLLYDLPYDTLEEVGDNNDNDVELNSAESTSTVERDTVIRLREESVESQILRRVVCYASTSDISCSFHLAMRLKSLPYPEIDSIPYLLQKMRDGVGSQECFQIPALLRMTFLGTPEELHIPITFPRNETDLNTNISRYRKTIHRLENMQTRDDSEVHVVSAPKAVESPAPLETFELWTSFESIELLVQWFQQWEGTQQITKNDLGDSYGDVVGNSELIDKGNEVRAEEGTTHMMNLVSLFMKRSGLRVDRDRLSSVFCSLLARLTPDYKKHSLSSIICDGRFWMGCTTSILSSSHHPLWDRLYSQQELESVEMDTSRILLLWKAGMVVNTFRLVGVPFHTYIRKIVQRWFLNWLPLKDVLVVTWKCLSDGKHHAVVVVATLLMEIATCVNGDDYGKFNGIEAVERAISLCSNYTLCKMKINLVEAYDIYHSLL